MSDAHQPDHGAQAAHVDVVPAPAGVPTATVDETVPYRPERRQRQPWSRRRKVLVGSFALAGVVAGGFAGTTGWRIATEKDAMLTAPGEVAGLRRDDSRRATETADYLRTGLAADVRLDRSLGAVYADPADAGRSVLLAGGTSLVWSPERDLERAFDLLTDQAGKVTGIREMPAGALGGVVKCGSTSTADGALAVCGWADHGSLVLALFPGRDVTESGALLLRMRPQMQSRH